MVSSRGDRQGLFQGCCGPGLPVLARQCAPSTWETTAARLEIRAFPMFVACSWWSNFVMGCGRPVGSRGGGRGRLALGRKLSRNERWEGEVVPACPRSLPAGLPPELTLRRPMWLGSTAKGFRLPRSGFAILFYFRRFRFLPSPLRCKNRDTDGLDRTGVSRSSLGSPIRASRANCLTLWSSVPCSPGATSCAGGNDPSSNATVPSS